MSSNTTSPAFADETAVRAAALPPAIDRRRRNKTLRLAAALGIAPLTWVAACIDDASGTPATTIRDSAGVRITESVLPTGDAAPLWRVAREPVGVIGDGRSPDHELNRVGPVLRLRDGRIVVANRNPLELRILDSTGAFLSRVGREGAGPGEFRDIASLQRLAGDSILVFDRALRRISVFAPDGRHATSAVLARHADANSIGLHSVTGRFDDGTYLAQGSQSPPREGIVIPRVRLARMTPSLDSAIDVGEFAGDHILFSRSQRGNLAFWPPMFGRTTQHLLAGDGFYVAHNDTYDIRRYDLSGRLRSLLRLVGESRRLTERDFDVVLDSIAALRPGAAAANRELWRREISHYQTLPAYSAVLLDGDGNLWVREYGRPGKARNRWAVFGPDDAFRSFVDTPGNDKVLFVDSAHLLVLTRTEADEERVLLYRLEKISDG